MEVHDIKNFTKGWFIGNFNPSLMATNDFEVALKKYKAGDYENSHVHKIAVEYTLIVSGSVLMNDIEYHTDSIITINPGEYTDFKALTDVVSVVIKTPCVKGDKYE